jgi:heterodisulfide reductase subunit A2
MSGAEKKVGVYICHCGGNIGDYVDVDKVRAEVEKELGVQVAKTALFTCSDATQQEIIKDIQEQGLDGLVVASCSPKLHLQTFRNAASRAGLNPYQYIQVNIREQCSWAHSDDKEGATRKAVGLVRGGIEKVQLQEALEPIRVISVKKVLIIGGGIAGLRASLAMADLGVEVFLIEKERTPGGAIASLGVMYPTGQKGADVIGGLLSEVRKRSNITIFTGAELAEKSGHIGDFSLQIRIQRGPGKNDPAQDETIPLNVGAVIVASGFESYTPAPDEFGRGLPGVVTLPEFERLLQEAGDKLVVDGKTISTAAFIYCVGSRQSPDGENARTYCSRFCCNAAVHAASTAAQRFADLKTYHFYRDLRTYGKFELLYEKAGQSGAVFLRFPEADPPAVRLDAAGLRVTAKDLLTGGEEIELPVDLVVLVTGMQARPNDALTKILKLPIGLDKFYNEIHPKLRPVETVIDGVTVAGCCQGPKNSGESVASALSATSKAASLLVKGYVDLQPFIAYVLADQCVWCGECEKACPYSAIERVPYGDKEVARVLDVSCKGCGACLPVCLRDATQLKGYTDMQMEAMIEALGREAFDAR